MPDLKDELERERREREWVDTWKPDPGEMLVGTLEGYDEAATDYGKYTVAHIRDEDGVLRGLWLMHTVLEDEWKEAGPEVGERVGVQYLGERSGAEYDYHMWVVKVDRPNTAEEAAGRGANRAPQDRNRGAEAPNGREHAERLYGGGKEAGGGDGPTLDPNEELPF